MNSRNCENHTGNTSQIPQALSFAFPRGADTLYADLTLPAEDPPQQLLVLVNGFQRPRTDFRSFRRRLHNALPTFATLAIDNRGSGESSLVDPGSLDIQMMAKDVVAIAEHTCHNLGLAEFSTLGISMGGMISMAVAAHTASLSHLILVSTGPGGSREHIPSPLPLLPRDPTEALSNIARYFGQKFYSSHEVYIRSFAKTVAEAEQRPGAADSSRAQRNAVRNFDGTPLLSSIGCPTLVIVGKDDHIIPPENSRFLAAQIPLTHLEEYPDVGHLLLIEEPQRFAADVARFLAPVL